MLYRVVIWRPCKYERGFEQAETWIAATLQTARLQALEKLPTAYETFHSARMARHPWADISRRYGRKARRTRNDKKPCMTVETPIQYVPSVGDLGYTP